MNTVEKIEVVVIGGIALAMLSAVIIGEVNELRMSPEEKAERDKKREAEKAERERKHREWFESLSEEEKLRYVVRTEVHNEMWKNRYMYRPTYTCHK